MRLPFYVGTANQTQVLVLVWQALYSLSHCSNTSQHGKTGRCYIASSVLGWKDMETVGDGLFLYLRLLGTIFFTTTKHSLQLLWDQCYVLDTQKYRAWYRHTPPPPNLFLFLHMCVHPCDCIVHLCRYPLRPEEVSESHGLHGKLGNCEVFLTTGLSNPHTLQVVDIGSEFLASSFHFVLVISWILCISS